MAADGVGEQATLRALTVLQSMLERAVEWGRLESNPARRVRLRSRTRGLGRTAPGASLLTTVIKPLNIFRVVASVDGESSGLSRGQQLRSV